MTRYSNCSNCYSKRTFSYPGLCLPEKIPSCKCESNAYQKFCWDNGKLDFTNDESVTKYFEHIRKWARSLHNLSDLNSFWLRVNPTFSYEYCFKDNPFEKIENDNYIAQRWYLEIFIKLRLEYFLKKIDLLTVEISELSTLKQFTGFDLHCFKCGYLDSTITDPGQRYRCAGPGCPGISINKTEKDNLVQSLKNKGLLKDGNII